MVDIRSIVFDYGGTLTDSRLDLDGYSARISQELSEIGHTIESSAFKAAFRESGHYRLQVRSDRSELSSTDFFTHTLDLLNIPPNESLLEKLTGHFYDYNRPVFNECLPSLLENLSGKYKVALLSNSWIDAPRVILERDGYAKWFDVILCSCDTGVPKPYPEIFLYLMDELGVSPSEAVMVGDSIEADMKGALTVGMQTIWVEKPSKVLWTGPSVKSICDLPQILEKL